LHTAQQREAGPAFPRKHTGPAFPRKHKGRHTSDHWVRFPQVIRIVVSGDVVLWLAGSGVVGTWSGTGSPDPHEGGLSLPIRTSLLEDLSMLEGNPTAHCRGTAEATDARTPRAAQRPAPSGCDAAAQAAIWAREVKPSLIRMCSTWFSAVRCEITSSAAMSLLLRPAAIRRATCSSRAVSGAPSGTAGAAGFAGGLSGCCRA